MEFEQNLNNVPTVLPANDSIDFLLLTPKEPMIRVFPLYSEIRRELLRKGGEFKDRIARLESILDLLQGQILIVSMVTVTGETSNTTR